MLLLRLMTPFQDRVACYPDPNQEANESGKLCFLISPPSLSTAKMAVIGQRKSCLWLIFFFSWIKFSWKSLHKSLALLFLALIVNSKIIKKKVALAQ